MMCKECHGCRLVGWSGAGPHFCRACSREVTLLEAFEVITAAWREQRSRAERAEHARDEAAAWLLTIAEMTSDYMKAVVLAKQALRGRSPSARLLARVQAGDALSHSPEDERLVAARVAEVMGGEKPRPLNSRAWEERAVRAEARCAEYEARLQQVHDAIERLRGDS